MGPKSEKAYLTIHQWVSSGKYLPGSRIPSERSLERDLGIGRTQLRVVLSRLISEGVIESYPRSSYRVVDVPKVVSSDEGVISLCGRLQDEYGHTYTTLVKHVGVATVFSGMGDAQQDPTRNHSYLLSMTHFLMAVSEIPQSEAYTSAQEHISQMVAAIGKARYR